MRIGLLSILCAALACSCMPPPPFSQTIGDLQAGSKNAIRGVCISKTTTQTKSGSTTDVATIQIIEVYNTAGLTAGTQLAIDAGFVGMCGFFFTCDAAGNGPEYFIELYSTVSSTAPGITWSTGICSSTREFSSISDANRQQLASINCPSSSCVFSKMAITTCPAPASWAVSGPGGYCEWNGNSCSEHFDSCPSDPYATCSTCSSTTPCDVTLTCTNGYCLDSTGNCPQPFQTSTVACVCPMVYAPVCGVDGTTYGNTCELGCAGVAQAYNGECGSCASCGGFAGFACPNAGDVCVDNPYDSCDPNNGAADCMGLCQNSLCIVNPPPTTLTVGCVCPMIYAPVCGADGNTYGNTCELNCAGVALAYSSTCSTSGCVCPMVYAPVCGVDGNTYGNTCELGCAGVVQAYNGECGSCASCGGFAGFACPNAGDVCVDNPYDSCDPNNGGADCMGLCQNSLCIVNPPPTTLTVGCVCPMIYAPVCGADGNTYGNTCELNCAGVALAYSSTCSTSGCVCPMVYAPVCGVDGNTYGNTCELGCAGVVQAYNGECGSCASCGGFAGFACPNAGDVCVDNPYDSCDPNNGGADCMGLCQNSLCIVPSSFSTTCICPEMYAPVCGADGVTYSNQCSLDCANVAKAFEGECDMGGDAIALGLSMLLLIQ